MDDIDQNLSVNNLSELKHLNDAELHVIVRNYPHDAILIGLIQEPGELIERVISIMGYHNIRNVLDTSFFSDKLSEEEITEYQRNLLRFVNQLSEKGSISFNKKEGHKKKENGVDDDLRKIVSVRKFSNAELIELFLFLSQEARRNGVYGLEKYLDEIKNPLIKDILGLILDGFEYDYLECHIKNLRKSIIDDENIKFDIITTGVSGILKGYSSTDLKGLLYARYKP